MTQSVPSPLAVAARIQKRPPAVAAVQVDLNQPAKLMPGLVVQALAEPEVLKAKRLVPGMVVRAWNSQSGPRGAEKVVGKVTRLPGGSHYEITFTSPHPTEVRPAAYRFAVYSAPQPSLVPYVEA